MASALPDHGCVGYFGVIITGLQLSSFNVIPLPVETHQASVIAGSCFHHSVKVLDHGFYDYPLLDPETVAGGGVFIPIGTWAKGKRGVPSELILP